MSFSVLTSVKRNRCAVCGKRVDDATAGIALLGTGAITGNEAATFCIEDGYDELYEVIVGLDWQEEYLCHSKCLHDAITDAAAEVMKREADNERKV